MKKLIGFLLLASTGLSHSAAGWETETTTDKMSGKQFVTTTVVSDNSLDFSFPYAGENKGMLTVRHHPQWGVSVMMIIVKGQIQCPPNNCSINIRFDDGPITRYWARKPTDNSSSVVFLMNHLQFIEEAKKAKKILVQFTAFRQGSPVLEFTTTDSLTIPPASPQ